MTPDSVLSVRTEIRASLQGGIKKICEGYENSGLGFICYQDIQAIWSKDSRQIQNALGLVNPSVQNITLIQSRLLKTLSILIYIKDHATLDRFLEVFFDEEGQLICSDDRLPLEEATLEAQGFDFEFTDRQYIFIPVSQVFCSSFFVIVLSKMSGCPSRVKQDSTH